MKEVKPLSVDEIQKLFKLGLEIEDFRITKDTFTRADILEYHRINDTEYMYGIPQNWKYYPHLLTRLIEF